jgi:hypothetical protein
MTEILSNSRGRPLIEFEWDLLNKTLSRGGKMPDCVILLGCECLDHRKKNTR